MDSIIDQTPNLTRNFYLKKTLQFLVPISIISFLVSYFSLFSLIFHPLQFYYYIVPSLALDRRCMFLICNGILAFLAKNLKLKTSAPNHGENIDDEYGLVFHENAAYVASLDAAAPEEIEIKVQQEQDDEVSQHVAEEIETEMVSDEWEEDEDDDDEEIEESEGAEDSSSVVSDMRVSTEELNKKFDEFIRKMKEEIRIEARQQYIIAL